LPRKLPRCVLPLRVSLLTPVSVRVLPSVFPAFAAVGASRRTAVAAAAAAPAVTPAMMRRAEEVRMEFPSLRPDADAFAAAERAP